ncbi:MAG TPA: TetR family transcriptional regulator [Bradyrhizobium sp.]|nr:TetR family transcriptional regulator [Bradyrhizobium sp.]
MREVARRAGVSAGAPFRHFESRNAPMPRISRLSRADGISIMAARQRSPATMPS